MMNRLRMIVCGAALFLTSWPAQAQNASTKNDMPLAEFRQIFVDFGAYLDAHKGTDLQRQFAGVPANVLANWSAVVKNPREFQNAVAILKQHDAALAGSVQPELNASLAPRAVSPSCPADTIIDISQGAQCTPSYPDPSNNSWQKMIGGLIPLNAFTSGASFTDISSQHCGLTVEASLQLANVVFQGITQVGSLGCAALPSDGPGNACFGALSAIAIANAASDGLWTTCSDQDGLVNAAELDAGLRNTVKIYDALKSATGDIANDFSSLDNFLTNLGSQVNSQSSSLDTELTNLGTQTTGVTTLVGTDYSSLDGHLTNVNNQVAGEFGSIDTHLTNVDSQVTSEAAALDAHIVALINQLAGQVNQGDALLGADLRQAMKLELTPHGLRVINPAILTCTGTNCPNVLAACPAAGCSWNNVGPLP